MRFLLVAGATMVAVGAPLAGPAPAQTATAGEQLVCTNHIPTGTRFARRTCRTRAEREEISAQHRRDANELIDGIRPNICSGDTCRQVEPVQIPPRR